MDLDKLLKERDDCLRREQALEQRLWRALHWVKCLRARRGQLLAEVARLEREQREDHQDVADIADYCEDLHEAIKPFAAAWQEMKASPPVLPGTQRPLEVAITHEHFRQAWEALTHRGRNQSHEQLHRGDLRRDGTSVEEERGLQAEAGTDQDGRGHRPDDR